MARTNDPSSHWKERLIMCSNCGESLLVKHPKAKYCKKCAILIKEENIKYKAQIYGRVKTFAEKDPVAYEKMCNEITIPKQYLSRGKISLTSGITYI